MSRIDRAFAERGGRPLVIPFLTVGYPRRGSTVELVAAMARAGADIVELGMPFSDPLADGPTIQRSSERAIGNGTHLGDVLAAVQALRDDGPAAALPLVLMGYCNPLFHYGLDRFLDEAAAAGVDGLIVPDLPPEEAEGYRAGCEHVGIGATFLMAPNAADERIRLVDSLSTSFSYCVSITGVTGARGDVHAGTEAFLARVGRLARKPFVVGFGVKSPEHVARLGPHAAGVVVGSALIDAVDAAADPVTAVTETVTALRRAAERIPIAQPNPREPS